MSSTSGLQDAAALADRLGGTDYHSSNWYVAYTKARHEKKVSAHLQMKQIEVFVPLYKTTHRWNGRRAALDLPLFPCYVFVHISKQDRMRVLEAPGVIQLVGCKGVPIPLPDAEIEQLRTYLSLGLEAEPFPYLSAGDLARIVEGPLAGLTGMVVRRDKETRFVLSVDLIASSVAVSVEASQLERICAANLAAA
jgi:transcription antitermination factor NusG